MTKFNDGDIVIGLDTGSGVVVNRLYKVIETKHSDLVYAKCLGKAAATHPIAFAERFAYFGRIDSHDISEANEYPEVHFEDYLTFNKLKDHWIAGDSVNEDTYFKEVDTNYNKGDILVTRCNYCGLERGGLCRVLEVNKGSESAAGENQLLTVERITEPSSKDNRIMAFGGRFDLYAYKDHGKWSYVRSSFDGFVPVLEEDLLMFEGIKADDDNAAEGIEIKSGSGEGKGGPGLKDDGGKAMASLPYLYFPKAIERVAEVATMGAKKYSIGGWRTVPDGLQRYTDALHRHLLQWSYEEKDEESGLPHLAHAAWNVLAILQMIEDMKNDQE